MGKAIKKNILGFLALVVASIFLANFFAPKMKMTPEKYVLGLDSYREDLMMKGMYRCCLEEPCSYCLKKEDNCDCMDEVLNGEHPCGECIGEILEGKGNKFLAGHFAEAIADEVGVQHLETIKQIISEKYNI